MPRIEPLTADQADSKAAEALQGIQKKMGRVPNIFATFAHSPAVLQFYLNASDALSQTSISAALREQIALTTAGANTCEYCASAHNALAEMQGVGESEREANLAGISNDPKTQAALTFVKAIVEREGFVTDDQINAVREAGYSDGEIIEILTVTAMNIFTNYFNHLAQTAVDFPQVELPQGATA